MDQKNVFFNGARVRTWKDKEQKEQIRYIADMYMPGVGAYDVMLSPEQYAKFVNLQPGTAMAQSISIEIRDEVVAGAAGGRAYAVRRPSVRFGDIVLAENAKKAS